MSSIVSLVRLLLIVPVAFCGLLSLRAEPPIKLNPTDWGGLEIHYLGVLQASTDMSSWYDINPQPQSPWLLTPFAESKFFRSKAVLGNGILEMPGIFSEFMVLQRDVENPVWGYVAPGADVRVEFGEYSFDVVCDANGRWEIELPAMPITWAGRTLRVRTGWQELTFNHVVVGDVWLAAGGTAMNRPMSEETSPAAVTDRETAFDDMLRVFGQEEILATSPRRGSSGVWRPTYTGATDSIAALPYFTVKKLREEMGIPTGVIECAVDGMPVETFISAATLASFPEGQALAESNPQASQAFNGLIAPLAGMPVRGFIWMPDAADATASKAPIYNKLAAKMAEDWRAAWGDPSLPFYFVQPPNTDSASNVAGEGGPWVLLQDELRQADLEIANTSLVVANDVGDSSDPAAVDKEKLGERLGQLILPSDYVESTDYPNSPLYESSTIVGSTVEVTFTNANGLRQSNSQPLSGFEIRESRGEWLPATATISGSKVILSSDDVTSPVAARYAWDSNPVGANLVNVSGLPASPFTTPSPLELNGYFSNGMILQREKGAPIWGWTRPGSDVSVTLGSTTLTSTADHTGRWQVTFANLAANSTGRNLSITTTTESTILTDVLVGEVWLGSGQSNMSHPLGWLPSEENDNERATANDPLLRVFVVEEQGRRYGQRFCRGSWLRAQSSDIFYMPATPYYFAKRLREELNVPVAVLECGWGGQPIQAFITKDKLQSIPEGSYPVTESNTAYANWEQDLADYQEALAAWQANPDGPAPTYPSPDPHFEANLAGQIYNGMIAPLVGTGLRGILWYHGEQDTFIFSPSPEYGELLVALVQDWRARWNETLPFHYMQLPNFDHGGENPGWVTVQDEQRRALPAIAPGGMAIGNDIGDPANIHPANKSAVGDRLSRWALVQQYGKTGITVTGPLYQSHAKVGATIEVQFTYGTGLKSRNGEALGSFEIKNASGNWVPATATISGTKVVVSASGVSNPTAARYAWNENPTNANLVNGANLPASVFTTE